MKNEAHEALSLSDAELDMIVGGYGEGNDFVQVNGANGAGDSFIRISVGDDLHWASRRK